VKVNREKAMKKLDWKQMLGFDQVAGERDRNSLVSSRLGGKIGVKVMITDRPSKN
jgi:hypothetical protein